MNKSRSKLFLSLIVMSVCLISSQGVMAGNKMKVKGNVEAVTSQVEEAFSELELKVDNDQSKRADDWSRAVATSDDGSKITVSINRAGKDECEISINSTDIADRNLEEKILELMISR